MFSVRKTFVILVTATLLGQPLFAGSAPRLVPQGSVKKLDSGVVMDQEMPVPAGSLMACNGQCYVEANGLQLMGADKTVFAVQENAERYSVMVQKGSLDFALGANAKPVEFKTPFDTLDVKPYAVQTGSDAVVRGNLQVTDDRALLTLTQGSLELTGADGQKLIHAGNTLVLAQANTEGGAASKAMSQISTTTIVAGGLAVGAVTAGAIAIASDHDHDDDDDDVSPF